jgi:hypothetical protein
LTCLLATSPVPRGCHWELLDPVYCGLLVKGVVLPFN